MRKILNFLKSKTWKRILWIFAFFSILWIFFLISNVYAQVTAGAGAMAQATAQVVAELQKTNDDKLIDFLNLILKLVYLLVHVCIILAWWLLDNGMIYWKVFHLDAPLRKFWNIMKNFANFILWFLVLYSIIKSIFSRAWTTELFKIIKETLIAGILIQASRFLLAAVIDVSTIATYAVWWIPLTVMKSTSLGNTKVLWVQSTINLESAIDVSQASKTTKDIEIFYTYWNNVIWRCLITPKDTYIIWVDNIDSINEKMKEAPYDKMVFRDDVCVLYWNTVAKFTPVICFNTIMNPSVSESNHCEINDKVGNITPTEAEYKNKINQLSSQNLSDTLPWNNYKLQWNLCKMVKNWWDSIWVWMTVWALLKNNDWFQWLISTLYYSLLDFGSISDISASSWVWDMMTELIIKVIVAWALFLPLILLVMVLFMRIWYLRVIIVFSPIYVLKSLPDLNFKLPILWDMDDIKNIFKIIFSPVITIFALSISLIFMSALIGASKNTCTPGAIAWIWSQTEMLESIGLTVWSNPDGWQKITILGWLSTINFKMWSKRSGWGVLDMFSWLLVNMFGIAIVWTILFAAIKANKLWEMISSKLDLQRMGENFLSSMPIIPLGWWSDERVWMKDIVNVISSQPDKINRAMSESNNTAIENYLNTGSGKDTNYSFGTTDDVKKTTEFDENAFNNLIEKIGNNKTAKYAFNEANIRPTNEKWEKMEIDKWITKVLSTNSSAYTSVLNLDKAEQDDFFTKTLAIRPDNFEATTSLMNNLKTAVNENILNSYINKLNNETNINIQKEAFKDQTYTTAIPYWDSWFKSYTIKFWKDQSGSEKYVAMESSVANYFDTFQSIKETDMNTKLSSLTPEEKGYLKNKDILCLTNEPQVLQWKTISWDWTSLK